MLIDGFDFDLSGLRVMPGLINAHDHLEFGLFPRLGSGPYRNSGDWADDVYRPDAPPVREHLRVPKRARLLWGGLRNLIAGVTTVCHHNPYDPVFLDGFPVRVLRRMDWAHSLRFSPDIAASFRGSDTTAPFIVHAGEGTDLTAAEEIFRLHALGVLGPRTVLVHAVGFDERGWELIRETGASVVWCPSSNEFLFGRTVCISDVTRRGIRVALGTDSPLTAAGDLLDEIHAAAEFCPMAQIRSMLTSQAARVLRTQNRDYIAVKEFGLQPELVVAGGKVQLISERLATRSGLSSCPWYRLHLEGREPVLVLQDVPSLVRAAQSAIESDEIRLGGRKVVLQ